MTDAPGLSAPGSTLSTPLRAAGHALTTLGLLSGLACGGVSTRSGSTVAPGPVASPPYFVTLTASGATPQVTHVWVGRAVSFRNEDSRAHSIFADPHPEHHECSGLLNLGTLRPGERRELNDMPIQACFFHKEEDPNNRAFQGAVVVH